MNNSIDHNNSQHLHNVYYVPDAVFRSLCVLLIHLIPNSLTKEV